MIQGAIVNFIVACVYLVAYIVGGAIRFIVAIVGPGLFALIIAATFVAWYLGWFNF
jgi:hypothetical protein